LDNGSWKNERNNKKYANRKRSCVSSSIFQRCTKEATKGAGVIAELNVLRIVNETTAATIVFCFSEKNDEERLILILMEIHSMFHFLKLIKGFLKLKHQQKINILEEKILKVEWLNILQIDSVRNLKLI
jgi:hypothetical protein